MEENKLTPEFLSDIKRRNAPLYPTLKLLTRQIIIFVIAVAAGMLFCAATYGNIIGNHYAVDVVARHFSKVFDGCKECKHYFTVIITASATDIRYLLLMFATGFTYFCAPATSALVMIRGFAAGYSLNFLFKAVENNLLRIKTPWGAVVLFLLTELFIAGFMIMLSVRSVIFGYEFRKLRGRAEKIVRSPIIYNYMLLYLTAFGFIIFINAVKCLLSFLIFS